MKSKFYEYGGYDPGKMSGHYKKTLSILQDLIRINVDRINGYEKASHEQVTPSAAVRQTFYRLATDSRAYVNNLHAEVIKLGGAPVTESTITGKIYLHWLNGGHQFEGTDVSARVNACASAELAIQKAYQQSLDQEEGLPGPIYDLVEKQLWSLEHAYEHLLTHA